MKKLILIIFITLNLFGSCRGELFSIHTGENGLPLKAILSNVANKCNLTVITTDDVAKKKLDDTVALVNISKEPLKEFLSDLLATQNCFVNIVKNKIYISYYETKTYRLDIVSSVRSGSSSLTGSSGSSSSDTDTDTSSGSSNFSGTSSLSDTYQFDVWGMIKNKLDTILQNNKEGEGKILEPVIDKNSGVIVVTGNRRQIEAINRYMKIIKKRLMKQVYIDVKILSVQLSRSHQTGINWQNLSLQLSGGGKVRAYNLFGHSSVFKGATFSMSALLNVLAQYGDVNSISNPQIVTLNNQKAIIQVGENIYYKDVSGVTTNQTGEVISTQYTINSQFVGVSLDIVPSISDNNIITLYVYPTISQFATPPQTQTDSNVRQLPPDMKTNTLVSMVRLKNNQTLVLGGLITNDKSLQSNGVPVLKDIPLIKYLFSYKESLTDKKEIVFIITPHIVDLNKKVSLKKYGFGYKQMPSLEDLNVK